MTDSGPRLSSLPSLATIFLLALAAAGAQAQDSGRVTIEQLHKALAQRDAIIVELLQRVRALEQSRSTDQPGSRVDAIPGETPTTGSVADEREDATSEDGDFRIDALAAERALERGLVQEGARLLRPGQFEVEPRFAVSRRNGMFPATLMSRDTNVVGEISRTLEVQERSTTLRAGLPWASQLEIGLPHVTVNQTIETGIDGAVQSTVDESGSGAGDATLGFSKVLTAESGARPNLIGRLAWLSGTGDERDGTVFLGGGYSGYSGRLSASWRRDPVVFLLSGGYMHYEDDQVLRPGDSLDLSLGLGLALSPETAMVLSLSQIFIDEFERDGVVLRGTDRLASTLDLAVSTTLGRRLFLRGYTTAGLTDDAPDYSFGVSVSARFDMQ